MSTRTDTLFPDTTLFGAMSTLGLWETVTLSSRTSATSSPDGVAVADATDAQEGVEETPVRHIPEASVARLPIYLRALTGLVEQGTETCSSEELATATGVNSAKLRKDLSYLGSYGTRGVGYDVAYLHYQIAREIGLTPTWPVDIVGIGTLGHALAHYSRFRPQIGRA